jgi:hypothetical protein
VTEYWYSLYHGFKTRSIYGVSPSSDLAREQCQRRYSIKNKKISIETKDDYKKRYACSPDESDSFNYLLEMARRNGLQFIVNDTDEYRPLADYYQELENSTKEDEEEEYALDDIGED